MPNNSRENDSLKGELVKQLATLSASGFGLVAALAWNTAIQKLITAFVDKYLPKGNEIIASLIYAIIVTLIAVLVTYQISKLAKKFHNK